MAKEMNYCPVCGNRHAEIADCPKYGVNVCGAHCEICEYRIGDLPVSGGFCGYNSSARALKIPLYIATDEEMAAEVALMEKWENERIAEFQEKLKGYYRDADSRDKVRFRIKLAACQKLIRDRADDVIAETQIPQMSEENILEYRGELCRRLASLEYNARLKRALLKALELCKAELERRRVK